MTLRFSTTAQAAELHGIKVLIYSRSGVGKTWLARTAPAPIVLSAESGILSLRDVGIPMIHITSVNDLSEAHQWLEKSAEARQFKTVYIDSLTEIGEVILANAKALVKDPRQAYGELIEKTMATIKAYRDLAGKNVVMTAKQEPMKDDMTGIIQYGPSMPGSKLGPQLPYLFDEVFRLGLAKTKDGAEYRFFQTAPDLQYEAKDRSGALDAVEKPDLTYVFNKILGVK